MYVDMYIYRSHCVKQSHSSRSLIMCQRKQAAEVSSFSTSRSINPGILCTRLRAAVLFHGGLEMGKGEMREGGLK
jgi:hypothetical protein